MFVIIDEGTNHWLKIMATLTVAYDGIKQDWSGTFEQHAKLLVKSLKKSMTDTASQTIELQRREKKSAGRIVIAIVRIVLGLIFLVFGLNGLLNFIPQPK